MRAGRLLPVALLAAAVPAFVLIAHRDGSQRHRMTVTVAEATSVVKGQAVKRAGVKVGEVVGIEAVDGGRNARIELELDDRSWPLPRGTKMRLRWGGTANFSNRYIAVLPGRGPGEAVRPDGTFPARDFHVPVEVDELLSDFPERSRRDLQRFLHESGPAVAEARDGLRRTLRSGPPALEEAGAVLQDLDADQVALRTLVRSADDVLGAVHEAEPGIGALIQGAASTFDAIADETTALRAGLDSAPQTLRTTRETLERADGTLDRTRDVADRLRPGVAQLRRTAAPLNRLLRGVRVAGPDARATLATARRAAPDLGTLLHRVGDLAPQLRSAGDQAVKALKCIRPYTPDIVAFFTNWGDFMSGTDGKDKLLRAQVQNLLPAPNNASPLNSGDLAKLFPDLDYGFPRPPGYYAGQPWFLPECGAGPDALDPQKDPEIRPSAKVFDIPKLRAIVPAPKERRP